jgi:hypothetical protein
MLPESVVLFVDNIDNGNSSDPLEPEAIYITGHDELDAITGLNGGRLLLNGLNLYVMDGGVWINLQDGLPAIGTIPYKDGFIGNRLPETTGDFDGSRCVDGSDLGLLLGAWGTDHPVYDLNGDGTIDGADLGLLLGNWGCP